jgi:hypothetical protein
VNSGKTTHYEEGAATGLLFALVLSRAGVAAPRTAARLLITPESQPFNLVGYGHLDRSNARVAALAFVLSG